MGWGGRGFISSSSPASAALASGIASLAMGLDFLLEALGHLVPSPNGLCCSTWCAGVEHMCHGPE